MVTDPLMIPVTTPVALTVAIVASLTAQEPPETVLLKDDEPPGQTVVTPDIVPADGAVVFTVNGVVVKTVPQIVVTV